MAIDTSNQRRRIDARVPHETHEAIRRAAAWSGTSINQFLMQAALKEARAVIEREESARLQSHVNAQSILVLGLSDEQKIVNSL